MKRDSDMSSTSIFFRCLLQSVVIGVVSVVLFALLVVMLSSVASAQQSNEPVETADLININQPQQGSLLFSTSHQHLYRNAPLLSTDVSMDITAMTARVRLTQMFRNEGQDWVEGIYVFPLPENAAVDHMRMQIGERVIEGQIKERQQAKRIYQQAKSSGRKAALIEQERPNLFTNSVANIGPGESISITIEYQQSIRYQHGQFSIRFPLTMTPRYIPGSPLPAVEESLAAGNGTGWSLNTSEVADASRITPPVLDEGEAAVNPVTMQIQLNTGITLDTISSLYHRIDMTRGSNGKARILLAAGQAPADRDFVLQWRPTASHAPRAALFSEPKDNGKGQTDYYSLLMLMPPVGELPQPLAREVVFVIDTSGSMGGESIRQARSALRLAVQRLKVTDRFNVIQFNSSTHALFNQPVMANSYNMNRAIQYVDGLKAGGGTEMRAALNLALSYPSQQQYMQQVVFLTDGAVGNENALFQIIHDKLDDVRLFTVGIGSAPNSFFMRKAAQFGRGSFTYIGNLSEVAEKMGLLFGKLEAPMMRNLQLHWPDGMEPVDVYPSRLPDLYAGEPLLIHARSGVLAGEIRITGQRGQQPWSARFPLNSRSAQAGVGVLWARSRIESLMDSLHDGADKGEVRQQIIDTALNHHLVSKYTSLVAVDVTPSRPVDATLKKTAVPSKLPHGMQRAKVFGASMAKTATSAQLHMLTGFIVLLLLGAYWGFSGRCSSHRTPQRMSA
jgi:Ca-activated chloride channel family protein